MILGVLSGLDILQPTLLIAAILASAGIFLLPDLLASLGGWFVVMGKVEGGIWLCNKALALESENYLALVNAGYGCLRKARLNEAKDYFNRSIAKSPKKPISYINRSATMLRLSDYQAAEADALKAMDLAPRDIRANVNKIVALMCQCRHEEALAELQKVGKGGRYKDFFAYNNLICKIRLSRLAEAEQEWHNARVKHKHLAAFGEAWIAWEKGLYEEVLEQTAQIRDDSLDAEAFIYLRALAYAALGESELAYIIASQLIETKPQSASGLEALLGVLAPSGLHEQTLDACRRLEERNFFHFETNIVRAGLALESGDLQSAADQVEAALAKCPTNATALALQAIIKARQGQGEEALKLARANLKQNSHRALSWLAEGEAMLCQNNLKEQALSSIKKAVDMNRYSAYYQRCLARACHILGKEDEGKRAEAEAERLQIEYRKDIEKAMLEHPVHFLEDYSTDLSH